MMGILLMGMRGVSQDAVAVQEAVLKQEKTKKEVIDSYLMLKNSLVLSDSLQAATAASALRQSLAKFRFKRLSLEGMNASTKLRAEISVLAEDLSSHTHINNQRADFSGISEKIWLIIKSIQPAGQPLYQQVCPMTGQQWVSAEEEIKNPYYPKNMLTCGEVKAKI
jgi:Cu(I)/Ag(I) efflux system membrane fusion protein